MCEDILLSVIIPAYNAEKHLDKAVQSVLCQMDGNIELILVNDGSTDSTGAMCDAYAVKHPNIRVIHKENGGTSSAKNRGIAIARGAYLSFMDSDDYIDPTAYRQIAQVLREYQPDCLDFGWNYIDSAGLVHANHHGLPKDTLLSQEMLRETILPPLLNLRDDKEAFINDFVCNKILKAEITHTCHVQFDEDKRTWEDRTFLLRHLKHCKNYYSMSQCFYNYVWMPNSLSQRYRLDIFDIILANFRHYRELYGNEYDFDTEYAANYRCQAIENMIFRSLEETENREQILDNILLVLQSPEIRPWYAPTASQSAVHRLISEGNSEEALHAYIQQHKDKKAAAARQQILSKIKHRIKKVLGRA